MTGKKVCCKTHTGKFKLLKKCRRTQTAVDNSKCVPGESPSEGRGAAAKKSGGWKVKGGRGGGTPALAAAAAKSGRQAKTGAAPPLFGEVRPRYREND